MSGLATVLARLIEATDSIPHYCGDLCPACVEKAEAMVATPEGTALARLVNVAMAWGLVHRPWDGEWETDHDLLDAIDAYRAALSADTTPIPSADRPHEEAK